MMRRAAAVAGTCVASLLVLAVTTVGSLIGLNAECNGAVSECPRRFDQVVDLLDRRVDRVDRDPSDTEISSKFLSAET